MHEQRHTPHHLPELLPPAWLEPVDDQAAYEQHGRGEAEGAAEDHVAELSNGLVEERVGADLPGAAELAIDLPEVALALAEDVGEAEDDGADEVLDADRPVAAGLQCGDRERDCAAAVRARVATHVLNHLKQARDVHGVVVHASDDAGGVVIGGCKANQAAAHGFPFFLFCFFRYIKRPVGVRKPNGIPIPRPPATDRRHRRQPAAWAGARVADAVRSAR